MSNCISELANPFSTLHSNVKVTFSDKKGTIKGKVDSADLVTISTDGKKRVVRAEAFIRSSKFDFISTSPIERLKILKKGGTQISRNITSCLDEKRGKITIPVTLKMKTLAANLEREKLERTFVPGRSPYTEQLRKNLWAQYLNKRRIPEFYRRETITWDPSNRFSIQSAHMKVHAFVDRFLHEHPRWTRKELVDFNRAMGGNATLMNIALDKHTLPDTKKGELEIYLPATDASVALGKETKPKKKQS